MKHLWYLKNTDLFSTLPALALRELEKGSRMKEFSKEGELKAEKLPPHTDFLVVKQGAVHIFSVIQGKKVVLDSLGPSSFLKIPQDSDPSKGLEVEANTCLCLFSMDTLSKLLQYEPDILLKLFHNFQEQLEQTREKVRVLHLSAEEKIMHFLEKSPEASKLTHEKIAEHTGLSRETVSRHIHKIKQKNIL